MSFRRWGITIGKLSVTWYDLWAQSYCLEIAWGNRVLVGDKD